MLREVCLAALALTPVLAGCMGFGSGGASVVNNPDRFALSAGGAASGSQTYDWSHSGTKAFVSFQGGGSGTVSVRVADSAGREVFRETYSGSGGSVRTDPTSNGSPGTWKIAVDWSGAGGFVLRLDKG